MKILFAFLLLISISGSLRGQLLFTTLKQAEGLSSREVRCVFRDQEGFVWAGTNNGLNRFDGARCKRGNKLSPGYPSRLGEIVTTILEHGDNKIWFGTNAGIGILDKQTSRITEAKLPTVSNGLQLSIGKLLHDGHGRLWANTNQGLYVEQDGGFVRVSKLFSFAAALDTLSFIQAAFSFDAKRNAFWMGTPKGSYCLDLSNRQLFSALNNPDSIPFFSTGAVISLALDKENNLWFSNATTTSLEHYNFRTKAHQKITRINNNSAWWLNGGCNSLFCDRQGRLWISTWLYNTFIRYEDGRFEEIPYNKNLPHSIGYGFFSDAFQDKYDNVWLATVNGISKLQANRFVQNIIEAPSFKFYLPTGFANINAVQLDKHKTIWMGKMDGLVKFDSDNKSFERYAVSTTDLPRNEIFDVKFVGEEAWCATAKGLQIFNPTTKKFRTLIYDKKFNEAGVRWIVPLKSGEVWFSMAGQGVYRYDPLRRLCTYVADSLLLNSNCAFQASDGTLWLATQKYGVRLFDPATEKWRRAPASVLNQSRITAMTEDRDKNIWVALLWNGLIKCNAEGLPIDSVNRGNGLPIVSFNDICVDISGRLWAVSRENLLCILPATKEITKVDIPANFSFNDHWNALIRDGSLLYGAMLDNVVVMNTEYFQKLPQHASPIIAGLSVFGKEVPLPPGKDILLDYDENFFSVSFASPFHQEAQSMQYAYKLENFDKDWVFCGRNLTASYTNVPDGNYRFLVKTTDEQGKWMNELTVIPIVIRPPFWKTWWFIALFGGAGVVCLYYLYRFHQKQQREKLMEETIGYFANVHYGDQSINEICSDIARNCATQLKLEDCVVYLMDEKQNLLVRKASAGLTLAKELEGIKLAGIEPGAGIVGAAAVAHKAVVSNDTSKDSRYRVGDQQRLSELAVPIVHEGQTVGVIDSENSKRNFFREYHVKTLSTIAAITASKIAEAKAEAAAKESEIALLEIKKLYAESQLMALRAQMNPHFVFNCLNSIQECIVTSKYGEASLYLNKFGKLFRSVLNNSGKALVTLAEEIEVLDLYLTLEHMRFEKSFNYNIDVDEGLEVDEILVPSMLLQPYVENALWHGLMHKQADRRLDVVFRKKGEDVFECIIDDNGIGRKKAMELKEQQSKTKRHVSRGMTISKDRLELLQKQGQHATLNVIDKFHSDGQATGTMVVVELSAFLQ